MREKRILEGFSKLFFVISKKNSTFAAKIRKRKENGKDYTHW